MKKLILVLILVLVSISLSADTVEETNGFDWVTWSFDKKVGYIEGFMAAYSTVMEMIIYESGTGVSDEQLKQISNKFYIPLNVGQVGERIDSVYSDYSNREIPLYDVIMIVIGKDYWNGG